MEMPEIRQAAEADRATVLNTITMAFVADPLLRWALPDAGQYMNSFGPLSDAYGGRSIDEGACFMTTGGEGAAMWLPPGITPDEEAVMAVIGSSVPEDRQEAFGRVLEATEAYHPHDDDCWYLAIIGVDAGHQGKGLGATLMKHVTRMLDERGALGYLESSNPKNISLYERHGFEIMGEISFDGSPVMTPMVRARQG